MPPIYLDYNATTPIESSAADAMIRCIRTVFGNPSSSHEFGAGARAEIDAARVELGRLIGTSPRDIIFTGCATEANNLAIRGLIPDCTAHGRHIITSAIEHPAVLEVCRYLERSGAELTILRVDERGVVDPDDVRAAIRPATRLITIMHANNETGVIQPIAEIAGIAREHGIPMHTDAAQSVGKIPVDMECLGVDLLTIAGHKFGAPKGIGALVVRSGLPLNRILHGAGHENGRRPGTENLVGIVGLGAASRFAREHLGENTAHLLAMRDQLEQMILGVCPSARVNSGGAPRLPNTSNIAFPGIDADDFIREASAIAVSAGAACHSGTVTLSHVLKAMNVPMPLARGSIRFSTGFQTTPNDIRNACMCVCSALKRLGVPIREDE